MHRWRLIPPLNVCKRARSFSAADHRKKTRIRPSARTKNSNNIYDASRRRRRWKTERKKKDCFVYFSIFDCRIWLGICICSIHAIVTVALPHIHAFRPRYWWGDPTYTELRDPTPPDRYRLACCDCSSSCCQVVKQANGHTTWHSSFKYRYFGNIYHHHKTLAEQQGSDNRRCLK